MASDRSPAVAVYCASSPGAQKAFRDAAISLGTALAQAGRPLVYGGGSKGIMGTVSSAALQEGGRVVGVIPYAMIIEGGEGEKTKIGYQDGADTDLLASGQEREKMETIVVNSMHERKIEMAKRVGGFIGLPGGFGTFEEVFEAITWTQIGFHCKPVVLLNVLSYYSPLRELIRNGIKHGFVQSSNEHLVVFVDGPSDLSRHETFDWGKAALEALDTWTLDESLIYGYDWSKKTSSEGETQGDKLDNV